MITQAFYGQNGRRLTGVHRATILSQVTKWFAKTEPQWLGFFFYISDCRLRLFSCSGAVCWQYPSNWARCKWANRTNTAKSSQKVLNQLGKPRPKMAGKRGKPMIISRVTTIANICDVNRRCMCITPSLHYGKEAQHRSINAPKLSAFRRLLLQLLRYHYSCLNQARSSLQCHHHHCHRVPAQLA